MTVRSQDRIAADRLDSAFDAHASAAGDFAPDYADARAYRDEGYALGNEAFDVPEEDREDWIESQTYAFPEHARYLVSCAASARVADLEASEARRATIVKASLFMTGAAA